MNVEEKLEIAHQLSRLGVDICEAGFPTASPGDFEAVRRIAQEVGPLTEGRKTGQPMVIAGLSRASKKDIERAFEAVKHAPRHRIHTFLATSDIHLKHKLKIDREECIQQVIEAVTFARSLCDDVEFSPEDAGRSDPEFLTVVLGEAIKAGAMDYVAKPFAPEELLHAVSRCAERYQLLRENAALREQAGEVCHLEQIVGECAKMRELRQMIQTFAPTDPWR